MQVSDAPLEGLGPLPPGCRRVSACLDYKAFVFQLDTNAPTTDFQGLCEALRGLGRARPEALGVTYVDADWGFLVIPPRGFPELKLSFFQPTTTERVHEILTQVSHLLAGE